MIGDRLDEGRQPHQSVTNPRWGRAWLAKPLQQLGEAWPSLTRPSEAHQVRLANDRGRLGEANLTTDKSLTSDKASLQQGCRT